MLPLSALVIIILGYVFNCCNAKTDLLCFLSRMFETNLPRIKSASLGEMLRNLSSTEARIFLTGTPFDTIAKVSTDTDTFHFSLTIPMPIFALLKPQLKEITVRFFLQYVGHINKWNRCTS